MVVLVRSAASESGPPGAEHFRPAYRCPPGEGLVEAEPAIYSGFYEAEFESSSFKMSHHECDVWLTGEVCPIFRKGRCAKGARVRADITVEGVLSPSGNFGHFGMWERELRVTRVIKVERLKGTTRGSSENAK
jgi:hypothetical protein